MKYIIETTEKGVNETLKAELLAFLELGDDEFDISSMGEFEEQFVEFIKDDLSYAD